MNTLKIYRIWDWTNKYNYIKGCYSEAIVVAYSEEEAKIIHPNGKDKLPMKYASAWATHPEQIDVEYLGEYSGERYSEPSVVLTTWIF